MSQTDENSYESKEPVTKNSSGNANGLMRAKAIREDFGAVKSMWMLAMNSKLLVSYLATLYLKKYDKILDDEERRIRNRVEPVVFYSSLAGKMLTFSLVSKISFIRSLPFNPIRDVGLVLSALATLTIFDSAGIIYYWPQIEGIVWKAFEKEKEDSVDLYKDSFLSPLKIFYYKNFI
jgi:hypothetical protein